MRHPRYGLRWLLSLGLVLVLAQYLALTWLAPHYVLQALEHLIGGSLSVERVRVSFPLTTELTGVRLITDAPETAFTIQRAVIKPRWISFPRRTVWINTLELRRPFVRFMRTKTGKVLRPTFSPHGRPIAIAAAPWRIHVDSIQVIDGIIEWVDQGPTPPFHGALEHLFFDLGPVTIPDGDAQTAFALRARFTGDQGHSAPLYCSGWTDLSKRDLQSSCQLEPLTLAAFDPYFHGPAEVRVYTARLKVISQWLARANELKSRIHLGLDQLSEGDLSVHGRTILDIKHFTQQDKPQLSGELTLVGLLDQPRTWAGMFLPGDTAAQQLVTRLISRGVQVVRVPFGTHQLGISIVPASQDVMIDIETASREVQEALELLATPVPEVPVSPEADVPSAPSEVVPAAPELPSAPVPDAAIPASPAPPITPAPEHPPTPPVPPAH